MLELQHPCIECTCYKDSRGYGQVQHDGSVHYAHRVAYVQANGLSIKDIKGIVIRHKCDNPSCIEPTHLIQGTQAQNMEDKMLRGRAPSILDKDTVLLIRSRYVPRCKLNGQSALAREFGVSQPLVNRVVKREIWRHV